MLKRIKLVQGIGSFGQTRGSSFELAKVNVVYGENRNGKSTLCDVLHSLESNNPELILNRKSIPGDATKPPKVELQFEASAGNHVARFENRAWQVAAPDCSKLYVFDHSFIHRNVITGQKQERQNSENVTGFILGEANTALYKQLADLNESVRAERSHLTNLERQIGTHGIANAQEYANSAMPTQLKQELEMQASEQKLREQQIATTIQNADAIRARRVLVSIAQQVDYNPAINRINSTLAANLQNVHQGALSVLEAHISHHVNNSGAFKGWAAQGLGFVKGESCPFCGQGLGEGEKGLIATYQQAFNTEFDNFNNGVKQVLDQLRQPFLLTDMKEHIGHLHQANKDSIALYIEPEISANSALPNFITSLDQQFQAVLSAYDSLESNRQAATNFWLPILNQKYSVPYEPIQVIDFSALLGTVEVYNQTIYSYWQVCEQINGLLTQFKASIEASQLRNEMSQLTQSYNATMGLIKRIDLEPLCNQYREKSLQVLTAEATYNQRKEQLEQSQSAYLENYFDSVNRLFTALGSNDFEIDKVANNRGKQVVYEVRVKFKGQPIPVDKVNFVFSESDRRALALCIFLAKVISLSPEEKSKAILVFDDPVTSFDNERITLILNKLDELQREVKQLIITTHYKGMASKAVKKFRQAAKSVRLVRTANGIDISAVDNDTMTATEHDAAFDRIKAFVDREVNDNIITELRPFFEVEIRGRYKKQLTELGVSKEDLSVCINTLCNNGIISNSLAAQLNALRDSLNTPMHEIGQGALENTRSIASQILDVVYNELTA
ncbi:AAA family ATPase [Aliikangiella coralliicola]|uniref:AAA family ATPase n=1 Tax=Aliikangiella coralliicola TaxID=2592383 RepID=A0A545UIV0_9GAMM|nr:AAA family ATPase [Aliikangiella coralliicola]TQV89389.1 AAA family ATPase [Aliikangiella coralliicola]